MWKRPHFLSYILLILLRVLLVCRNEYELRIIVFESIIVNNNNNNGERWYPGSPRVRVIIHA